MTETVKLEIFIPESQTHFLRDELAKIGVGKIEDYNHCSSISKISGSWRSLPGSNPYQGEIGKLEHGEECRLEMSCSQNLVPAALEAVRRIHPYETPVVNIVPLLNHLFE